MYIRFDNSISDQYGFPSEQANCVKRGVSKIANFLLTSRIFSLLTLGHLHTLVHEMGHAITFIALTGGKATIKLSTKTLIGKTDTESGPRKLSNAGETYFALSGSLANLIFSAVLIVGIFALTHYVPMSQGLSLGLRIGIVGPAAFWVLAELFYAVSSACSRDEGDFGEIAKKGCSHLAAAFATLITIVALTALGVVLIMYF